MRLGYWLGLLIGGVTSQSSFSYVNVTSPNFSSHNVFGGQRVLRPHTIVGASTRSLGQYRIFVNQPSIPNPFEKLFIKPFTAMIKNPNTQSKNRQNLVKNAYQYIIDHPDDFNLSDNMFVAEPDSIAIDQDFQSVNFAVFHRGIMVADAYVTVHFKFGEISQIFNYSYPRVIDEESPESNSGVDLMATIKNQFPAAQIKTLGLLYRIDELSENDFQYRLVTEFLVSDHGKPFLVQLDNFSGNIFEIKEKYLHSTGKAEATIYPRFYNETAKFLPLKELVIEKNNYTDDNGEFASSKDPANLILSGKRIVVTDKAGKPITLSLNKNTDKTLSINYVKSDKPIKSNDMQTSQAMVYYHGTEVSRYAQSYLPSLSWLTKPLKANANVPADYWGGCNAYWDGVAVNFYQGSSDCANTGLIADVIYHEWGHGLDANTGGIKDNAYSEGYGDIIATIMTRSPKLGIGFYTKTGEPVRELATDKIYPKDRGGGPHNEGLIIGSTFWDLYQAFKTQLNNDDQAIQVISTFAFKMIQSAVKYTDVYDTLLTIDDNDNNVANGTPNLCLINKVFKTHGLAKANAACP